MNNFADLQLVSMIEFSFNTLPHQFNHSLSQISPLIFFFTGKGAFYLHIFNKKILQRTKILISPVWNKILKFYSEKLELPAMPPPKKNVYYIFTYWEYLLCLQSNASAALKITTSQQSLTVVKTFATAKKPCRTVTMTTTT